MTVESLCRDIANFGFFMVELGFASDANAHKVDQISSNERALSWTRNSDSTTMIGVPSKVEDYRFVLENRDYFCLMNDGGIIQIAFTYDYDRISGRRLLCFPCPFRIGAHEIGEKIEESVLPLDRIAETEDSSDNVLLQSPIRFDYAPRNASKFHPASHVTLNNPDCRIPVRFPLRVHTFIQFVFENFYLTAWEHADVQEAFVQLREEGREEECLSAHDGERAFLDWN